MMHSNYLPIISSCLISCIFWGIWLSSAKYQQKKNIKPITPPNWKNAITQENYQLGFWITAIVTFLGTWIYCICNYGFLLGVGIGWLPAAITGIVAGLFWPFVLAIMALGMGLLLIATLR